LIADLSAYSAQVEDLCWALLHYRVEEGRETVGTTPTVSLSNWARIQAEATRNDLNGLLPRVTKQASHPEVRRVGVTLSSGCPPVPARITHRLREGDLSRRPAVSRRVTPAPSVGCLWEASGHARVESRVGSLALRKP
jgi:hypothetical protein